jgi:hypothetical protein
MTTATKATWFRSKERTVKTLLGLLPLAALAAGTLANFKRRSTASGRDEPWPFYSKKPLTTPEQVLYHRLVASLPGYIVLAQVQLSRVLGVTKGVSFNEWNNRINRLTYDFVVCGRDATVIAAIELDDKSHERSPRSEADARKARATAAAGIPLLRWNVAALPDAAAIQDEVAKHRKPVHQVQEGGAADRVAERTALGATAGARERKPSAAATLDAAGASQVAAP